MNKIYESLQRFSSTIPENFANYMKHFPVNSQAAESIHQGLHTLVNESILKVDGLSIGVVATLGFGAHSSWINAFNMTLAGHVETGFSEIRRAIEFVCYAAKIKGSDERANSWMKQRSDPEAMKKFSGQFQIPSAYVNLKFEHLRPLLLTYDMANYYGAHGNLETMAGKIHSSPNPRFSYQSDKEIVIIVAPHMILTGYRILQSLIFIYEDITVKPASLKILMSYIEESIKKLRFDAASHHYNGEIPDHVRRFIQVDDQTDINEQFDKMILKDKQRKQKKPVINNDIDIDIDIEYMI